MKSTKLQIEPVQGLPYGFRPVVQELPRELRFVVSLLKRDSLAESALSYGFANNFVALRTGSAPPSLRTAQPDFAPEAPTPFYRNNCELVSDLLETDQTIDWGLFLTWVTRHKVVPAVFTVLSGANSPIVPDHALRLLQAQWRKSAFTSLAIASQVLRLVRFFEEHEIKALPFKGVCAAKQIHGEEEAREPGDIDLIVSPDQVDIVDDLLRGQGYVLENPGFELTPLQEKKFREWAHSFEYLHAAAPIRIDLHWRLFPYRSLLPIDFNTVWNQGEIIDLAGHKVRTLSLEHSLLLSVAHAASHGWSHLFWLHDFVELLRRNRELDWHRVVSEAQRLGVMRHFLQALVLGRLLLDSPIPEITLQYIQNEPILPDLISHSIQKLTATNPNPGTPAENARQIRYLLKLSPRMPYKWEILRHASLYPPDWRAVKVPDALFPLYYILRPILWLQRGIR